MGVIDERAIANLSLAAELTKNIEIKLAGGKEKRETLANLTPKFMWILKDFTLELIDENGRSITSNDYLEDCLSPSKIIEREGAGESAIKIREAIIKLFRQRECMVFVRPVEDESELQNLNALKLQDMRPEFVKQFMLFKSKVFTECPPKTMNNKPVNGRMLSSLLEQYVKAINEGAVPNISTAWENVVDTEIRRAYEAAMKLYKAKTDQLATISELPIEQDLLVTKLFQLRMECDAIAGKSNKFSDSESSGKLFQTYVDKLKNMYQVKEEEIKAKNAKLSEEQCHTKLAEVALPVERKVMENKYTLEEAKVIQNDITDTLSKYEKEAKGPAKVRVIAKEIPKYVRKIVDSAGRNNKAKLEKLDNDYKVRIQEMETKTALDRQELERLQDIEKTVKTKLSNTEALMKQGERNEQDLARKVDSLTSEKNEIEQQCLSLKEKLEAQKSEIVRLQKVEKDYQQKEKEYLEREKERRRKDQQQKDPGKKTVKKSDKAACGCIIA